MSEYKVGDKVVYEVKEIIRDNVYFLSGWKESEPLSTYTEPLEAKIRRQAAEITRLLAENERLKAENKKMGVKLDAYELYGDQHEEEYNQAFNQGAEAAWELARKCMLMTDREREAIFGSGHNALYGVLTYFDYKHAAAKVAEQEKAKEEIKVGDVVSREGLYGVVKSVSDCWLIGITASGNKFQWLKRKCTKTGRHIDIDSFLKQIGGNGNER